ncbi:MAG: cytochrome b/b6 domain-containing protein [Sphingomonas sp.]|uniref:cytochrome b/b6 domain-containing protein n=1 Tax=Sphingomonas sp. TaxID=28214 RepID=UPI00227562C3|nr:cytochrome b/b6 domain-containing protein [Sphingomonas sp.]MCX8475947.1 cytochrome b/b6 domain-containing protein [Sphingomonas sp.]
MSEGPEPPLPPAAEPAGAPANDPEPMDVKLWDLPVRLVHWGFALLLPAMWATAEFGQMPVHRVLGYVALGLLLFRLYWGVAGSSTARFASFVRGPGAVIRYLRAGVPVVGHNPLGALSVIALLGLLGLQIGLGLFAQDSDGLFAGPLAALVGYETSDAATEWHETVFNILLGFVVLHIAAVLFYLVVRRDNLVRPMVTGRKRMAVSELPEMGSLARALIGVAGSGTITLWIAAGAPLP